MTGSGSMGSRKYYQHVEKDPENINSIWKALHTVTFLLLILNSLISAYMFGDVLKMFNYRCILHLEPYFDVIEARYFNETHNETVYLEPILKNITEFNQMGALLEVATKEENKTRIEETSTTIHNITGPEPLDIPFLNFTSKKVIDTENISETLKRSYIYNDTIWYKNDSLYGKVNARVRGSTYGTTTSCDLVLFVPLASLIAAAAFGALIILFGRGQASERSWFMVYPVLIASAIMVILYIIATVSMRNGIQAFCLEFKEYTGYETCSRYMDFFYFHGEPSMIQFWENYVVCYYSYIVGILLWIVQLFVTISRLIAMADFQFIAITVDTTEINANEQYDEKLHNALLKSGMKPAEELFPSEEDDVSVNELTEKSTNF